MLKEFPPTHCIACGMSFESSGAVLPVFGRISLLHHNRVASCVCGVGDVPHAVVACVRCWQWYPTLPQVTTFDADEFHDQRKELAALAVGPKLIEPPSRVTALVPIDARDMEWVRRLSPESLCAIASGVKYQTFRPKGRDWFWYRRFASWLWGA